MMMIFNQQSLNNKPKIFIQLNFTNKPYTKCNNKDYLIICYEKYQIRRNVPMLLGVKALTPPSLQKKQTLKHQTFKDLLFFF